MRLGLDTYSLRWQGWDAFTILDYAAGLGLDNVQFSERGTLASLEPGYLEALKQRADALGLTVELGMLSFDRYSSFFRAEYGPGEQQLADMVRAAAVVGSPIVRCVLGGWQERIGPISFQQHIDELLRVVHAVTPLAQDHGVMFALENHGGVDFLARELRALVESAGSDRLGVCLDTGNPAYAAEDPLLSTEVLAPYVVATQVRDTRIWSVDVGAKAQWAPLGDGNVDVRRIADVLASTRPEVAFNIEIITGELPKTIPYAEPDSDFWRTYPDMLARDFARFVTLAEHGRAEPLAQLTLPEGVRAPSAVEQGPFQEQQRRHFEISVAYARDVLGLGRAEPS